MSARSVIRWGFAALVPVVLACGGGGDGATPVSDGPTGKLVITGSSTVAPLAAEIAVRFEARHPGTRIDVQTGGSSRGIADARSGIADLGMASRALTGDEQADLVAHTVAHDGVCLIVHRDNPIATLGDDAVRAIFTGAVDDWSALGGEAGPITVVNKASGRATLEVFMAHFGLDEAAIAADVVIGDNQQGLKTVAATPGAIGYVSIGAADYAAHAGEPIKLLATSGIAPTAVNVASGRYPITRPLNLLTPTDRAPGPLAQAFLDFALSQDVHDLVTAQLFVPANRAEVAVTAVSAGSPESAGG